MYINKTLSQVLPVNKITEILLKVALNTINHPTIYSSIDSKYH
jgi:hypothetical protein